MPRGNRGHCSDGSDDGLDLRIIEGTGKFSDYDCPKCGGPIIIYKGATIMDDFVIDSFIWQCTLCDRQVSRGYG